MPMHPQSHSPQTTDQLAAAPIPAQLSQIMLILSLLMISVAVFREPDPAQFAAALERKAESAWNQRDWPTAALAWERRLLIGEPSDEIILMSLLAQGVVEVPEAQLLYLTPATSTPTPTNAALTLDDLSDSPIIERAQQQMLELGQSRTPTRLIAEINQLQTPLRDLLFQWWAKAVCAQADAPEIDATLKPMAQSSPSVGLHYTRWLALQGRPNDATQCALQTYQALQQRPTLNPAERRTQMELRRLLPFQRTPTTPP